jgi:hypothetical protein
VSGWIKIFRLIMACTANGVQLDRISDLPAGRQVSVLRVRGSNPLGVTMIRSPLPKGDGDFAFIRSRTYSCNAMNAKSYREKRVKGADPF